jgi:tRNA1(Val) A37 N6-methylase TrmN6
VLNAILESVKHIEVEEGVKLTVVDLCSGYGFLSMFLSELLPPEKVRE